jgi:glycosyltransferase involved in cell wall biosynthesis
MPRANALTCVSEDMVQQYRQVFPSSKHICIYNIIDSEASASALAETIEDEWLTIKTGPMLVAAGSLVKWKGFADLIHAMDFIVKKSTAKLIILGEGPMRHELEKLIIELDLERSIKLVGNVSNPLKYFSRCEIFVLSSHVEGLPNVLVEAMMCGCTPVSTNCPTGPREVLRDGKFGYLVPVCDPRALADGVLTAIEKPIPRQLLTKAIQPFSSSAVLSKHFNALGF